MAIVIEEQDTFWIKSDAEQPLDFAETKKHTIKYRIKKFNPTDWKKKLDTGKTVNEIIEESLIDFEGLGCNSGEFSKEDKAKLIDCNWLINDIWNAQVAIQNGKTYGMQLGN